MKSLIGFFRFYFLQKDLREVDLEELLPRNRIEIDIETMGHFFYGKRVLITGAAGSIGREIAQQIAMYNPERLVLVDQAETPLHEMYLLMARAFPGVKSVFQLCDICNTECMEEVFQENRPDFVFHAAAYKHVPMLENNPKGSVHNNVNGTRIVADLAVKYGTEKFVMVSTDKAVNPTNVMGCSKRICEIYVQSLDKALKEGRVKGNTRFVTTRFGNVLGSNGSVVSLFMEQIKKGGPVTVTHPKIVRYFMLIPEACSLVLDAGLMGHGGEIYAFDMGSPVKIVDLAKRMIRLSGAKNIKIEFTGLRKGEKLYEEVLAEGEHIQPTVNSRIKVAKVREYDYEEISRQIDSLINSLPLEDDMQIVRRMKELVPEYVSRNSKYEVLDV